MVFSQFHIIRQGWSPRIQFWRGVCGCALFAASLLPVGCAASRSLWNARTEESQRLVQQAHQAEDRGDNHAAEAYLTEAVKSNPGNCETRLELSELLVQHGSMEEAEENLQRLVAQNPDDPRGHIRLAQVRYHQRRYAEAKRALDVALEIDPMHTQGLLLRGKLDELRQRDDWALEAYHRAMLSETEQVEAELRIAAIHLKRGKPQQAAPLLRSIAESPKACPLEKSEASWMLGTAYAQEERWADASAALDGALPVRKMSAQDWQQAAYARYRSGNWQTAAAAIDAALELAPNSQPALSMRAFLQNPTPPLASNHNVPSVQSTSASTSPDVTSRN